MACRFGATRAHSRVAGATLHRQPAPSLELPRVLPILRDISRCESLGRPAGQSSGSRSNSDGEKRENIRTMSRICFFGGGGDVIVGDGDVAGQQHVGLQMKPDIECEWLACSWERRRFDSIS